MVIFDDTRGFWLVSQGPLVFSSSHCAKFNVQSSMIIVRPDSSDGPCLPSVVIVVNDLKDVCSL